MGREGKRRGDGHPLAFANGTIARVAIGEVVEIECCEHLCGNREITAEGSRTQQDLVTHGVTQQRAARILGHEGDEGHARLGASIRQVAVTDKKTSALCWLEPCECAQERALAATVGAE